MRAGAVYAALLLVTVVMLYPFWLMGQMSFRSLTQYYLGQGLLADELARPVPALPVGRELVNSTLITSARSRSSWP